jgi:transposase-like protein
MPNDDLPGILTFLQRFPEEDTCWEHLRKARWPDGFTCPMCSEDENWIFLEARERWHCYECGHQTSVTSQTILENTNLDLQTWFLAAYLVFTTKKGFSNYELAHKLEVHQETAWYLQQRLALIAGPYARRLFGIVEIDESYIGGKRDAETKGRSTAKAPVFGAVEAKDDAAGDVVLEHVDNAQAETIDPHVEENVDQQALARGRVDHLPPSRQAHRARSRACAPRQPRREGARDLPLDPHGLGQPQTRGKRRAYEGQPCSIARLPGPVLLSVQPSSEAD